ncbi:efflux RND transporter periplasmic adaptor subunit [Simkania negevensis]|uniref:Chemiosmotic efflux system B protein B n=1 Tax=Simkania negevensis (strain ATCC VR-1471 / DSM 27360 / Z) TaxID=331113 RepID=F8L2V2_SIMNZ|nr:efflux RND transporter periplasmic adaptor subunit [Simkania negevensis]CCB87798.1 chemiosmotic efflux system B protein B [Simkania negevensis Z]
MKPLIIYLFFTVLFTSCSKRDHDTYENSKKSNENKKSEQSTTIVIESSRLQMYGITTELAQVRDLVRSIRTVGIVAVDERKIFKIQTKITGWIEKLYVDFTNKPVFVDAPLFTVYSPELYATQEEYLLALSGSEKIPKGMFAEELKQSNKDLLQAARERMELWDVPMVEISRLHETKKPSYDLTFFSPVTGIVLEKNAYSGMNVGPGINLFTIADLSWVWVFADIYEQDISLMKLGQDVNFSITAFPDLHFKGSISFINYVIDPKTRTLKVRIDVDNPSYLLKPEMYGVTELQVNMGRSLAIPQNAVIETGLRNLIFIEEDIGRFVMREVELGYLADGYYQVLSGVREGEKVVTNSQFLLDSESRISGFGSGETRQRGDH